MKIFSLLAHSSLGKKYIMAITGAFLFGFVIVHLVGNLQFFAFDGGKALNAYAELLKSKPGLLWPARLALILTVILHIWSAARLTAENRAARPVPYAGNPAPPAADYASRTMLMSGLIIASFIVYHLLHFTLLYTPINFTSIDFSDLRDIHGRFDVYTMLLIGFSHPLVCGFYILAIGLLSMHLNHGLSAMVTSLGWRSSAYGPLIDGFARTASIGIFIGFISIPLTILLGLVQ